MHLSDLKSGESGIIVKVLGHGGFRKRILEMGFVRGQRVTAILNAPLRDPIKYKVMDYEVSLRRNEAAMIEIVTDEDSVAKKTVTASGERETPSEGMPRASFSEKSKEINVALVGNPNSGKTSLFNALAGRHEHVGNYSGVTVDAKSGHFKYKGYNFNITDLPGTYAITAYSPEEVYVRRFLMEQAPDIILNAVVASNLERNLYLTTELIDINQKTVVALNMYDELEKSGARLDYTNLGKLIGIPMVPVVAKEKIGLDRLLDTIIAVYESDGVAGNEESENEITKIIRHIHIKYSPAIEKEIAFISNEIKRNDIDFPKVFPPRYWSIKLLEYDRELDKILSKSKDYSKWAEMRNAAAERIKKQLGEDAESAITNEKYGFISGALKETFIPGVKEQNKSSEIIDSIVTHKVFSFPIFLLLMWLMFYATYTLGAYPQAWLEAIVGALGNAVSAMMGDGPLKDLIVDGIIGGAGSVVVFLPNILILYLFISLMEDSGYMARAAFIMDKLMHKIGLHGKSFIPLIMGFGCNVPAIMSARTIESRSSRIITILINPFMSCSARIPVYVLIAGTFFPKNSANVLMLLYLLGIAVAVVTARLLRKFMFKEDETPFVMELPPYRTPTLNATLTHLWEKCVQYLKKIGNIILLASIIIWFLSYYPVKRETAQQIEKGSYLEQVGKAVEPVVEPLGLNWKASVALISGAAAKEIVVSTLGVLYSADADNTSESVTEGDSQEHALSAQLIKSGDFTKSSAMALMVFVLLYFPCIGTIATIANEAGSWKYALFSIIYTTCVAWIIAFLTYNICNLIW